MAGRVGAFIGLFLAGIVSYTGTVSTGLITPAQAHHPSAFEVRHVPLPPKPQPKPGLPRYLPKDRIVAYYGNPLNGRMGILGQGSSASMISELKAQAAAYAKADPTHPVVPALELVAVVAQGHPGAHDHYRLRMPYSLIQSELKLARENHFLLILDVQVGHSTVQSEVRYLEPFLKLPDVELALDPEFDMPVGDIPGQEFGTMRARDINWAIDYLHHLVDQYALPQKILIVHQFIASMIPHWFDIQKQKHVAVVIDMDGFGGWPLKTHNYNLFITDQPVEYGGIKLFYTQDTPLATPQMVLKLKPAPLVVIYQ